MHRLQPLDARPQLPGHALQGGPDRFRGQPGAFQSLAPGRVAQPGAQGDHQFLGSGHPQDDTGPVAVKRAPPPIAGVLQGQGKDIDVVIREIIPAPGSSCATGIAVTGGGSGHKPAFIGFVGQGMLDAVAVGEIFTSPPPMACIEAAKAANGGKGVLFLVGNYAGDIMNFQLAAEMAEAVKKTIVKKTDQILNFMLHLLNELVY